MIRRREFLAACGTSVVSGCSGPWFGTDKEIRVPGTPAEACDYAIPPKDIPDHPRLAPTPAMHFDHYNSSVSNLAAPGPGRVDATLVSHDLLLGTCLNFLRDSDGTLYGFCGNLTDLTTTVSFTATIFDERLNKRDEYGITSFPRKNVQRGDLPVNLGYFVLDHRGRLIVVTDETDVVFLTKTETNEIEAVRTWELAAQLETRLPTDITDQPLAQVMPSYDHGYWFMALGDRDNDIPAYLGRISDSGSVKDVHIFEDETIGNGMALDESGAYVVTDHALYKASRGSDGGVAIDWEERYTRATTVKPGTENLSRRGSGSTPTLLGENDDLVAITDNAEERVNAVVLDRATGRRICTQPLFEKGKSANENTLVGYRDTIIAQNWYGAPGFSDEMWGMSAGLTRLDVRPDRSGCEVVWDSDDRDREFASRPTVRLSTCTGLLYGPIQVAEGDEYAMAFIDFDTGEFVRTVPFPGTGRGYRLSHIPSYVVPGGHLVQPVRRGYVVFRN